MIEGQHDRFKDAIWYKGRQTVVSPIIGGAGGIGSWLAFFLARAGFTPTVYDHDTFELHNMGGQLVDHAHIGSSKVDSLTDIINEFSDETINGIQELFTEKSMYSPVMFSAFDNMSARKIMFDRWLKGSQSFTKYGAYKYLPIFIDGRLLMEQMQIFCIRREDKENIEDYKKNHLFDDSEAPDELCTAKQTTHSAAMIAGFMTGFFTNHISNVTLEEEVRKVPYQTEYFIPLNLLV